MRISFRNPMYHWLYSDIHESEIGKFFSSKCWARSDKVQIDISLYYMKIIDLIKMI